MMNRRTLLAALSMPFLMGIFPALAANGVRLNPNTATSAQLTSVPGVSAALAKTIRAQRPFATMIEFNNLLRQTLSAQEAEAIYVKLFIPINLNTASRDEIGLIPGMSSRMVREFLEYRPYTDIGEFNREIGKYVDDEEVARLRSYVTL